jgi:hypothetical protein
LHESIIWSKNAYKIFLDPKNPYAAIISVLSFSSTINLVYFLFPTLKYFSNIYFGQKRSHSSGSQSKETRTKRVKQQATSHHAIHNMLLQMYYKLITFNHSSATYNFHFIFPINYLFHKSLSKKLNNQTLLTIPFPPTPNKICNTLLPNKQTFHRWLCFTHKINDISSDNCI